MKTALFITLILFSGLVNAWELSTQATLGRCSSTTYMQMCAEGRNVRRVSGQARHGISDHFNVAADLIHYSSWDGMDDLRGDTENQSGAVDFGGIGAEYVNGPFRLGAQFGPVRDSVGLFDDVTYHAYASIEQPVTEHLSVTIVVDMMGGFHYTGVGFNWEF